MFVDKDKVENLILELGLVDPGDFVLAEREAEKRGIKTSHVLFRKGLLNEQELQNVQMKATGVTFIDLSQQIIEPSVLTIIPEPIVRQYNVIAFAKDERNLKIALLDLEDLEKIDFLKKEIGLRIVPYLTDRSSLNKAILQYQELLKNEYGLSIQKGLLSFQTFSEDSLKELSQEAILELARSKQISAVFELLIRHALVQRVSSLHIEPQEDNVLIKYRISGELYPAMVLPKKSAFVLALKMKVLANLKLDIIGLCQAGRFQLGFDGKEIDFRLHIIPSFWGERIVLNVLQTGDAGFSLEAVGFHGRALDLLYSSLNKRRKLMLIAGPEHSGKTTTFYTILDLLKNPHLSISTIEGTIGFSMAGISQVVTKPEIGFDILEGIKQLSKQDCDVVAVDEIKELDSNHSVNSLLKLSNIVNEDRFAPVVIKTNLKSSSEIVFKLVARDRIETALIMDSLDVVILQKLIPKLSRERQEYYLNVSEIKKISRDVDLEKVMLALIEENILVEKKPWSEIKFFKSIGQNGDPKPAVPNQPEVDGQVGQEKIMVGEVLKISPAIKELIRGKATVGEIEKRAREEGMLTLKEEIFFKAVQGLVSIEKVLKN